MWVWKGVVVGAVRYSRLTHLTAREMSMRGGRDGGDVWWWTSNTSFLELVH